MNEIVCQNLCFSASGKALLEELHLHFHSAQINVILGQNGAGKSTLLKLLAKAYPLAAGKIAWHGVDLSTIYLADLAPRRAVVEQAQSLQFDFSVRQLVSLGLEVQFGSELVEAYHRPEQFEQQLDKILRTCDLLDFAERSVLSLSGGELKRAQIARAIAQIWPVTPVVTEQAVGQSAPDFTGRWLFLDEWNSALDIQHQQCFASLLRTWAQQGLGIIMVVHDLPLAMQLADWVVVLQAGKLFAQGPAAAVLTQEVLENAMQMRLQTVTTEQGQSVFLPKF